MSLPACHDIREQLDLYTARECDEAAARAVGEHLARCPDCARAHDQLRELLGLLDLHFQEPDRLRRLHDRLRAEDARRGVRRQPVVRRVSALAALVLLTFTLSWWSGSVVRHSPGDTAGTLALSIRRAPGPERAPAVAMVRGNPQAREQPYILDLGGGTPEELTRRLRADEGSDRLPPPPAVNLTLVLRNTGHRPLRVAVGGETTELRLVLQGPGVVRVRARAQVVPEQLAPGVVTVLPGRELTLQVPRLIEGSRDGVRYVYWTRPGDYTLTVHYRLAVAPAPAGARRAVIPGRAEKDFGSVELAAGPMAFPVQAGP
jgi:hypothetical protein